MNTLDTGYDRALAVFAHELREPLSSILLAARAMIETGTDLSVHLELGSLIERQGRYLSQIIDGVLAAGRRGGEPFQLHKEWFDLAHVIEEAVDTSRPILRERQHRLGVSLPARPIYLCADPLRIQQVMVNLMTNAAKYTEPGGAVDVTVEATNEILTITVRDNGIGMAAAVLPRIFNLFEQEVVRLPSAKYSGLGIGLTVVKSIVELHGGQVGAHSDGLGAGSAFTVHLPVFLAEAHDRCAGKQGKWNSSLRSDFATMTPMLDA